MKFAEKKFGVTFSDEQKTAIIALLTGSDIFVSLPMFTNRLREVLDFSSHFTVCYDFIHDREKHGHDIGAFNGGYPGMGLGSVVYVV